MVDPPSEALNAPFATVHRKLGISQLQGFYDGQVTSNVEIGRRVAESLGDHTQALVADRVGMTPDAMSRALRGMRAFTSVELAAIADVLDADLYWLVTGRPAAGR